MALGDEGPPRLKAVDPSERYVELVLALRDHLGGVRGWQSKVAKVLGAHPTTISKIARGERDSVGLGQVETAIDRGIARELFTTNLPFRPGALEGMLKTAAYRRTKLPAEQRAFWESAARMVSEVALMEPDDQPEAFVALARHVQQAPEFRTATNVLNAGNDDVATHAGRRLAAMVLAISDALRRVYDA